MFPIRDRTFKVSKELTSTTVKRRPLVLRSSAISVLTRKEICGFCLPSFWLAVTKIQRTEGQKLKMYGTLYDTIIRRCNFTMHANSNKRRYEFKCAPAKDIIEKQKSVPYAHWRDIFSFFRTNCQIIVLFCLYMINSPSMPDINAPG